MAKKTKTVQFQIPEPCSENWNKMHSLPGGRFCDNCEKTVVDFSEMTDNELVRFFERNDQKLCGRFRSDQLNKEIELPRIPSSFQKWKSVAAIAAGLLTWNTAPAQTILPQENISMVEKTKSRNGKRQVEKTNTSFLKNKLKGIVKDNNGEIFIGVNILLGKDKGTTTDIDGKFELEIPNDLESFEVTFSYLGYETQVIEFDKKDISEGIDAEVKMVKRNLGLITIDVSAESLRTQMNTFLTGMTIVTPSCLVSVPPTSKKDEVAKEEIHQPISNIYPNPFIDYVNVVLKLEKDQPYLFHLYNANGQLIWAKTYEMAKGKQELRLDFSEVRMVQGNYFLRITDGNREIQTKKIIKVNMKGEMDIVVPIRQ